MSNDDENIKIRDLTPEDLDALRSGTAGLSAETPTVTALVELLRVCTEYRAGLPGPVRIRAAAALRSMQQQLTAQRGPGAS